MTLTYGSLFSGTGMLDEGVQSVLGGELSWYAEFDAAASKVMAHHYPGVPNLGDVTKVDWTTVESVDVLTGGTPCQDLSHAGKRAGMTAGTRSNLWVQMREAIAVLRPRLVVWENVRGALSASADSDLEPCPGCVGGPDDGPVLRALGRVLGDLAELGYDARWYGLRAADVGAPHGRFRIFLFAVPADSAGDPWWLSDGDRGAAADTERGGWDGGAPDSLGSALRGTAAAWGGEGAGAGLTLLPTPVADNSRGLPSPGTDFQSLPNAVCALLPTPKTTDAQHSSPADLKRHDPGLRAVSGLLPTPRATDGTNGGPNQRGSSGDLMLPSAVHLLPTPAVNDMGAGKTVEAWDEWTARMKSSHGNGNGHGASLHIESLRSDKWGQYAPAIARWEAVLGRPAPAPTEVSTKSRERCPVHGDPQEGRPGEELRDMREGLDAQEVRQWATGGQGRIPKTPELLSGVREHQGAGHKGRPSLASQEAPEGFVRGLLGHEGFTRSPQGQEPREQRCGEPRNALCELPPEAALEGGPREADARESVGESCACKRRLSPEFVSWMMGLPAGWVTDLGLTRNEELKILGNGVVRQQAAAATRAWVCDMRAERAA
jgi:DNA (cytosine-5)-methyltransferase 1